MPKKLVLDRVIGLRFKRGESVRVPSDEVWRISSTNRLFIADAGEGKAGNGLNVRTGILVGAGANISPDMTDDTYVAITGLAFKLQEV